MPAEQAREVKLAAQIDQLVATCMRRLGLAYEPGFLEVIVREAAEQRARTGEYVSRYGFGIATTIGLPTRVRALPPDPNQAIRDRLDPDALQAWIQTASACQRDAQSATTTGGNNGESTLVAPSDERRQAALRDPAVISAARIWSECMAKSGYSYARPEDAEEDIRARAAPFRAAYDAGLDKADEGSSLELGDVFNADELAALEQLQTYELELAAEYHRCDDEYAEAFQTAVEAAQ